MAQIACIVLTLYSVVATPQAVCEPAEVTAVSGTLAHHWLTSDLFHIGRLWMRVEPDTEFHRWLSHGIAHEVAIILTRNPDRFADVPNARILSGTLIHGSAPTETEIIHILFLKDELTQSFGPITFQTIDPVIAMRFDCYDAGPVSIVIQIK